MRRVVRTAAVCLRHIVARPKSRIGHPTPVALRRAPGEALLKNRKTT